ncbi:hypothetical protein L3X38_027344 [Prunus dulcis]|uniref:Uncharacterized protein n=1 Tax=Prunus dulcis TaxID=3755 RepID=A0AAD4VMV6_PRUDU|nr:hypothetical protein L3X38_027344 [Prunus dulcis]
MARQFRYDWVQGQQPSKHRFVAGPDDYDDELEFGPAGYGLLQVLTPLPSFDLGNKVRSSLSTKEACGLQSRTWGWD